MTVSLDECYVESSVVFRILCFVNRSYSANGSPYRTDSLLYHLRTLVRVTPPTSWSVQNVCDYIGIVTGVTKESVELARNANLNGLQFLNQTDADILRLVNDNHIDANELLLGLLGL